MEDKKKIEEEIITVLKTVYDPEIPVNVYELGLIYDIDIREDGYVTIEMTLTAPACPAAGEIIADIDNKMRKINGVTDVNVSLTFDPPWDKEMMSEEAKLQLGFL
jgi:FeS assembly SUF system protein